MKRHAWLLVGYVLTSLALLFYSYTQVDLNLTLSRVSIWQEIQKAFQYVGYYQRPLSTALYLTIVTALFALYGVVLRQVSKNALPLTSLWRLILSVTAILVLSYPAAFSYDFFNYMFTAKTVLVYHKNPYTVIPLQFAGVDPWTNFMRWTHLPSAYPPLWIAMSLVPYLLGFGYFLSILFATKFLIAGFYLLTCWAVMKVMDEAHHAQKTEALALFALNPLILVETLVSGHNDIVLAAFAMLAVWMYMKKSQLAAWFFLSVSVAAKLMTIFLVPLFFLKKRDGMWFFVAMMAGLVLVLLRREFLPWYWVWIMPFIAILPEKRWLTTFSGGVSFGLLLRYTPYLYFGAYDPPVPMWMNILTWVPIGLSAVFAVSQWALERKTA